jgi:hypothetical protein
MIDLINAALGADNEARKNAEAKIIEYRNTQP